MIDRKLAAITLILAATILVSWSFVFQERQRAAPPMGGYANPQLLVDGEWVLARLNEPNVRIIDVRSQPEYDRGHIQTAVRLDFERLRITVNGVKNVAPQEAVESILEELGVVLKLRLSSMMKSTVWMRLWSSGHLSTMDIRMLGS